MGNLDKLVNTLKNETKSLKKQYLEKTEEWARTNFESVIQRYDWDTKEWCEYLNLTPQVKLDFNKEEFFTFPNNFYNTKLSVTLDNLQKEVILLKRLGLDDYIKKEQDKAETHYLNSIKKLAIRIEKKGLDISKLKATTSHIGVNIETTLTDGDKNVRAWTVLAYGPVQRPHYRYLIK